MTHKILIADDDASLRTFISAALRKDGHEVIEAEDGETAWNIIQNQKFELLLTDIVMPNMDGVELSTRAIVHDPNMKVMFMTGFTGMQSELESKTTVIAKPFHLNDIVKKVRDTLSGN